MISLEASSQVNVSNDWWQDFFSGMVVESWLKLATEEQTKSEVDFIQKMVGVSVPAKLLDVPCGGGRHSLALAAADFQMTAVDLSSDFLKAARTGAAQRQLTVAWEQRDMRDLPWRQEFDGAFCFGNSFGYFDDAGNAAFLKAVSRVLKAGAKFLMDCAVAENVLPNFQDRNWFPAGDIKFLRNARYDPERGRIDTEYTLIRDGRTETRAASHRIYAYRELSQLLKEAGFSGVMGFGSLTQEPFGLGSKRCLIVATRSPSARG
jgi:SAM-dependent methyltransferase